MPQMYTLLCLDLKFEDKLLKLYIESQVETEFHNPLAYM